MSGISNETQALLTGTLMGHLANLAAEHRMGKGFIAITDVQPGVDSDGNYTNTVFVDFESGTRLSVTVNEITVIEEQ